MLMLNKLNYRWKIKLIYVKDYYFISSAISRVEAGLQGDSTQIFLISYTFPPLGYPKDAGRPKCHKRSVYLLFLLLYCKELIKSKRKEKSLINNRLLESSICKYYITCSNNLLLLIICLWCHCSTTATISIPFHNPYSGNIYANNTLQKLKTGFTFNARFVLIRHRKTLHILNYIQTVFRVRCCLFSTGVNLKFLDKQIVGDMYQPS